MKFTHELITKFKYISTFDKIVVQTYIIKYLLKKTITRDLLEEALPDQGMVYNISFEIDGVEGEYTSCNFIFRDEPQGFVTKNGELLYKVVGEKLEVVSKSILDPGKIEIYRWFESKIPNRKYLNLSSIFYLTGSP